MKTFALLYTFAMLVACSNVAFGQHAALGEHTTLSQVEEHYISAAEHALVPVAEAMPEDKYSFAPTNGEFKGVRTFANQLKHVAASNYSMAAAILHEKLPIKLETDADLDAIKGKAEIVKFLQGSFDFLRKAVASITEQNETELIRSPDSSTPLARLDVADRAVTHCWNHYGQLIEYLRTSGTTPPSSHLN